MDVFQLDLSGSHLIEASAGTGKTYHLTELYLRLVAEGFGVDRILAVTFTEAATAELKERIRSRLRRAWIGIASGNPPSELDPIMKRDGSDTVKRRIFESVLLLDEAQIVTIHGFCHAVLRQYAFETGLPFDVELLADSRPIAEEIAADWWAKTLYPAPSWLAGELSAAGETPEAWADLLIRVASRPDLRILPEATSVPVDPVDLHPLYRQLRQVWTAEKEMIVDLLIRHLSSLKGNQYSESKLNRWISEIDAFLTPEEPLLIRSPEGMTRLNASVLRSTAKKNASPPNHPFFDLAERWCTLFDQAALWRIHLKRDFLQFGLHEWDRRKQNRQVLVFDDLVLRLYASLMGSEGDRLAQALRSRYPTALVDEFQDTDPYQYGIFHRIYGEAGLPFFMIGDPKQAVYGFRGADVYAYLKAADRSRDRTWRLDTNYRSDGALVDAVNVLFRNAPKPFLDERIHYEPITAARPGGSFRLNGEPAAPFRLIYLREKNAQHRNSDEPFSVGRLRSCIPRLTARLLVDWIERDAAIDNRPLHPGDVAILVRTNGQAFDMLEALQRVNVPAVMGSTHSVWETIEAKWIWYLLRGALEPNNRRRILTALGCGLFGADADTLHAVNHDEGLLDRWVERFRGLRMLWRKQGVFAMLERVMREGIDSETPGVWVRLAGLPSGERTITNLLHVSELLERQSRSGFCGPLQLLQWMEMRMNGVDDASEDSQLRLERDADAVQILTIHKSKGLEYPLVVCPYLWDLGASRFPKGPLMYHDPVDADRLILHLEPGKDEQTCWKQEQLMEAMRLLYVAVTRARSACVVLTAGIRNVTSNALGYLLHASRSTAANAAVALDVRLMADLELLAQQAPHALWVGTLDPAAVTDKRYLRVRSETTLVAPPSAPYVCRRWRISSFSDLIRLSPPIEDDREGRDLDGATVAPIDPGDVLASDTPEILLSDFDAGTQAGLLFHRVFETVDFMDANTISVAVQDALGRYGYDVPRFEPLICRVVQDVLATALDPADPQHRLASIPMTAKMTEMGFLFPASGADREPISPNRLAWVWAHFGGASVIGRYAERIRSLNFPELQGYLKGFIDLVFVWKQRWYIVDYKSNHLGRFASDYAPQRLEAVMGDHHYWLQAVLYTLALHRYLTVRLPGYAYERDIGSVYYLFIRGMGPHCPPRNGIVGFKPPFSLIASLDALFENRI